MAHAQSPDCRPRLGICDGYTRVNPHGRMILSTPRRLVLRVRQNNPKCKCLVNLTVLDKMVALGLVNYSPQSQQGQSVLSHQAGHGDPGTHTRTAQA